MSLGFIIERLYRSVNNKFSLFTGVICNHLKISIQQKKLPINFAMLTVALNVLSRQLNDFTLDSN
jgi:hypothetical protein